jgi:hypothetical protein
MSSIISEKYANLLSVEDVVWLFELLEKAVGNKVEAARICGLERKTTYDWETTKEARLSTKKKVLAALPEETLDFMTERSVQASVDILRTYLFAIYEKAMSEKNATRFLRLASKFEDTKQKYNGMITDYLETEVGNMSELLPEKAEEIGVVFRPLPLQIVRLSEFTKILPNLMKTISMVSPTTPRIEIARIFNTSSELIETISTALCEYYVSIRNVAPIEPELPTAATVEPQKILPQELEQPIAWIETPIRLGAS